jgi:hypothetical protein
MRTGNALAACTLAGSMALSLPARAQTGAPNLPPIVAAQPHVAATGARALLVPAATAIVRAAQVQIVDDQAHAPYKEGIFTGCTTAGVCTASFSVVPPGHRRIVEHLTCSVYVANSGALRYVAFLANNFAPPREFYPYTRSVADAGQYFVHSLTLFPFEAGETPLVYSFADTQPIQELTCTATGRDITL